MFGYTFIQRHKNGYFLDKKVDTSIPIIVLGQEGGCFFIKEFLQLYITTCIIIMIFNICITNLICIRKEDICSYIEHNTLFLVSPFKLNSETLLLF
ncbi:hypothetical protein BK699_10415 [Bacillus thuringiensis serovar mexicanensis]|uniref:Uncharacterized protein n=1 Tax=Bacillus thuringiensis serovar mexicanensis TaxID=180868 RepID=A0A242WAU5_BACTU|nr:hypothetical protein BK699_10415 [Bacillus thuringiensis serovar mexicanensis]OTX09628.1 hypothetical protein BK705_05460 [Bacillus thuringiensis serovar monterrey]